MTSDGVRLVYDEHGAADAPVLVLCHGLAAGAAQFAADAAFFAGSGFRVLAPDLRGHARSGRPAAMRREDFSISRMALDLIEMLDHAGAQQVGFVGNSLGGILALELLGSHPARIARLATFGTAYALNVPAFAAPMIPLSYRLLGRRLVAGLTARATTPTRAARPLVAQLIESFDPEVGRLVTENVSRYDLTANAVRWPGPILMLRGDRDTQVNRVLGPALVAMAGHPDFRLAEIRGAGHCANLDRPEEVRTLLLDFFAPLRPRPSPSAPASAPSPS